MCGRFALIDPSKLEHAGLLDAVRPDAVGEHLAAFLVPRYNIAPTQPVVVARTWTRDRGTAAARAERRLDVVQWGLVPSWARDPGIGRGLANARAETVGEKPAFRGAWKAARRCLVFADAFYEWKDVGEATADPRNGDPGTTGRRRVARAPKPRRQPYAVRLADDAPFAFAGLWEVWRDTAAEEGAPEGAPEGAGRAWLPTCTLVTTAPNTLMARLHDRMPVIVPREHYARWLDPETPLDEARAMLAPYAPEAMRAYAVTAYVNDPRHDDPAALEPAPAADGPGEDGPGEDGPAGDAGDLPNAG
jgi:putative SOS response-associated peptidase YedK